MKLDVLDKAGALDTIADELNIVRTSQAIKPSIICEHIRAIVLLGAIAEEGCSYSKLKTERTAYQRIVPLLKDDSGDFDLAKDVKKEVKHLLNLRDLVETPDGLEISPPRLLALDERTCLLIGGGPVHSLPSEIRSALAINARTRIISVGTRNKKLLETLPWQSPHDWLATAVTNQDAWCESLKNQARKKMTGIDEIEQVEVLENGYWTKLGRISNLQDLSLIRYKQSSFTRSTYALASIAINGDRTAKVLKVFDLGYDDARRFQGYLPTNGQKTPLQFIRKGEFAVVWVGHPLARPECRFLSLGWFTLCKPPHEWPRYYWFSLHLLPLLKIAATSLGFVLTEVSTLGKKNEKI
jgi:hypothetical protein